MIPHSKPLLGAEEAEAVHRVVTSGMIAEGPEVKALEAELASLWNVRHVCGLAHGTAGLHLALLAAGARPGTRVLVPTYSCVSLLNAIAYTGATPVLVDSAPGSPQIDLASAQAHGDDSVAAIVPHLFGQWVDVSSLAQQTAVIEDCTHSFGMSRPLIGLAQVTSFFATKMIAGGEGGALGSNDERVYEAVSDLRSYDEKDRWLPRYNYKMTDLAASILRVQCGRLPRFLARRAELSARYRATVGQLAGISIWPAQEGEVSYRFPAIFDRPAAEVIAALQSRGIGARRPVFRLIHRYLDLPDHDYPHATRWWNHCVSLPLYPALTDEQADTVLNAVMEVLSGG